MKRSKKLAPLLIAAALMVWCTGRHDSRSRVEPGSVATRSSVDSPTRRVPGAATWRRVATSIDLEPRERDPIEPLRDDLDDLSTAELDGELDAVIGDAESYWELSEEGRRQYDALETARLRQLGMPDASQRLAPWVEVLTLDGQPLAQEVSP